MRSREEIESEADNLDVSFHFDAVRLREVVYELLDDREALLENRTMLWEQRSVNVNAIIDLKRELEALREANDELRKENRRVYDAGYEQARQDYSVE